MANKKPLFLFLFLSTALLSFHIHGVGSNPSYGSFGQTALPSALQPLRYVVEYDNGTRDLNATWESIRWGQVARAGVSNGLTIGGFNKSDGSIAWYVLNVKGVTFSEPIFYVYQRFWGRIGLQWHRFYVTSNVPKSPWRNEVLEDTWIVGWNGTVNYLGYSFPVSLGLKLRSGEGFASLKTNVTTPVSLDEAGLEYQLYLNPYYVGDAEREIRWVRVYFRNGSQTDFPIQQFINVSTIIPDMVHTFTFLNLRKTFEVCYFNFSDVFSQARVNFADISQVTLPTGEQTYVLRVGSVFDALNAGETLTVDPSFGNTDTGNSWRVFQNVIRGSNFTSNGDGTADNITAYLRWTAQGPSPYTIHVKAALYFPNDTLVAQTNERTWYDSLAASWQTFTFPNPKPSIVDGQEYYIVVWGEGYNKNHVFFDIEVAVNSSNRGRYDSELYGAEFPDPANFLSEDYLYSVYCSYTLSNSAPSVGEWGLEPGSLGDTVYAWQNFNITLKASDADGREDIKNVTVGFMGGNYSWSEDTNSWSTVTQSNRINFVTAKCANETGGNSSSWLLHFAFQIYWNGSDGSVSVWAKVFDGSGASSVSTYTGLFVFESDLYVSYAVVDDDYVNPGDSVVFSGWLYYQGTSVQPYSVQGVMVKAELSGVEKGSNSSIGGDGNFTVAVSAESSEDSYSYNVYSLTDEASTTNQTVTVTVDTLSVGNLQAVEYLGSAMYRYTVQVNYTLGGPIGGASLNVSLPSGSVIGEVVSNASGWASFVVSQSNASEAGTYTIYGVDDNNYDITASASNETFILRSWTLTSKDNEGNDLSETSLTVTAGSTVFYSGGDDTIRVPQDTFNITVSWKGIQVNTTTNLDINGDTTTNITCLAYPYTYEGTRFWVASNATISSITWNNNILTVQFSDSVDTYVLKASCTTRPVYVLNGTYDFDQDWSQGLTLTHYANTTLKINYANWGGTYVQSTDKRMTAVSWSGQQLSLTFTGQSGETGQVEVYCGSRGVPAETEGFTTTSYSLNILTGTYSFASDKTVSLRWDVSGSTGGGGASSTTVFGPLVVNLNFSFAERFFAGAKTEGNIEVAWTGVTVIYVFDVKFESNQSWFKVAGLPMKLEKGRGSEKGYATIPVKVQVPETALPGDYTIPCTVTLKTENGGEAEAGGVLTFQIVGETYDVPSIMTYVFLGIIAAVVLAGVTRKK